MENKTKRNENKIKLKDFNCAMDKMDRDGEIKNKYFIGTASVMPCQISLWIMGLRIYREGRIHIRLSSPTTIGLLARIHDR